MMNVYKSLKVIASGILLFSAAVVSAQDPQLSQYYNAPLYLNPALAGTGETSRLILNYRNQWPGIGRPFTTYAFSIDHDFQPINSGIGLMVLRDRQPGNITTTMISPTYSYQVNLSKKWVFRPAIQPSFVSRGVDLSEYTFGDQLGSGSATTPTHDQFVLNARRLNYLDVGAGAMFYNKDLWIGVAFNHLNMPNQAFYGERISLPIKTSIHGGYKISLADKHIRYVEKQKERSITPTFNYKHQSGFDQLDLGTYLTYEPVMFGIWYRGIPLKRMENQPNNESFIFLAGFNTRGFTFTYSYDLTISKLASVSGGAHEISLIYQWKYPYRKKPQKTLPCPKF